MRTLVVVEDPTSWELESADLPGAEVVSARSYLTDRAFVDVRRARVFNLCRHYGYQTTGYYVSLLAEARAHRPMPSVTTLEDFRGGSAMVRLVSSDLQAVVDRAFAPLASDRFTLSIYFGKSIAKRYDRLAQALFEYFPAPMLRTEFLRVPTGEGSSRWRLAAIEPIPAGDVPEGHRAFLVEQAKRFVERPRVSGHKPSRADIAVLHDPDESDAPSDPKALERFARAVRKLGGRADLITERDYGRLGEYDALFIRATTSVNHYTYRFARRAESEGLVVIDDPRSIVRCTNKVYQAELFERRGIACPKTRVVHPGNAAGLAEELGFPVVLKQPDSAFSLGVVKVEDQAALARETERLFQGSELVVAQAFLRSDFDWRVGVLGGQPIWVCRYHMAKGHWQIQKAEAGGKRKYGKVDCLPIHAAPRPVVDLALAAAQLIGDGLYGVDIKEVNGQPFVMEVNDNPNLESGVEDLVGKEEVYRTLARSFLDRIEARGKPERK